MTEQIKSQNSKWAITVEMRNGVMAAAVDAARQTILDAKIAFLDALDAREKEIRWAITSIYNYDYQHDLNEGLTAARAALDTACEARIEDLASQIVDVEAAWASHTTSETASLNANTEEEVKRCEDTKQEQRDIFEAFKDAQALIQEALSDSPGGETCN